MQNEWVKLAKMMPWEEFEEAYAATFIGADTGNPAKQAQMAPGTLLIKERYGFSDGDTVKEIQMNPYLQHFIGLTEFTHKAPFDDSTITLFRKRVTPEMLSRLNDCVIGIKRKKKEGNDPPDEPPRGSDRAGAADEPSNEGTLILDATCAPQAIRYPTDVSLLNEAREKPEEMVITCYKAGSREKKPRTYCRIARKEYLRYARNRKPTLKLLRKTIKRQLSYVARDIGYVKGLLQKNLQSLTDKRRAQFETITKLYTQQQQMADSKTHSVADRIVSIHQPWVRPIVRGKAKAPVEFGTKIELSLCDGYARVED